MSRTNWLLFLRISPYAYFVLAVIALPFAAAAHCGCTPFFTWIFAIGFVWFVVARIISYVLIFKEAGERRKAMEAAGPVPTVSTDRDHAIDESRIRASVTDLDRLEGGCPAWVRLDVDAFLAAAPGAERDRLRKVLLQRLYDEAGKPGDLAQRRALNAVRLAINPWDRDRA